MKFYKKILLCKKGFTIFEIIVSISLMIMISSFFIYNNSFISINQEQQLHQFVSDINYIKQVNLQESDNSSQKALITLDIKNNAYHIKTAIDDKKIKFQNGVKLESYSGREDIFFYNDAWTNGKTIRLSISKNGSKKFYLVKIAMITGRVKLENE